MGMFGDFEAAIEEGATMVRIGTAIFGDKEYPIAIIGMNKHLRLMNKLSTIL